MYRFIEVVMNIGILLQTLDLYGNHIARNYILHAIMNVNDTGIKLQCYPNTTLRSQHLLYRYCNTNNHLSLSNSWLKSSF